MSKESTSIPEGNAQLEAELADLEKQLATFGKSGLQKLPSESDKYLQRLSIEIGKAGFHVASESAGAAVGQKAGFAAGLPFAPVTYGLAPLIAGGIGGALGGMGGYEASMLATGEKPTLRGRAQAAIMGIVPFSGEARLAAGAAGQLARVTGREMLESGGKMGIASTAGVLGGAATAEELNQLSASDVIVPALTGTVAGAGARYVGARTAESAVEGGSYTNQPRAAGPSSKAASETIRKAQYVNRDQDMLLWQEVIGGKIDPRIANPTGVSKTLQKISGESEEVTSTIRNINTAKAGEIVRREAGLHAEAQLTLDVYKAREKQLSTVFDDIKNLGRSSEKAVNAVQDSRNDMRFAWKAWKDSKESLRGSNPDLLEAAKDASAKYEKLSDKLEAIVAKSGRSDLTDRLVVVRPQLAKLAVAQSATNYGPNTIDVSVIGNLFQDSPNLVTDDLALLARIWKIQENAFMNAPASIKEASNRFPYMMTTGAAAGGTLSHLMGGSPAQSTTAALVGAGAGKVISNAASNLLTGQGGGISGAIQRSLATPQYQTNVPSNLSLFLAKSGGPAGSNVQSFIDRYRQEQQGLSPSR